MSDRIFRRALRRARPVALSLIVVLTAQSALGPGLGPVAAAGWADAVQLAPGAGPSLPASVDDSFAAELDIALGRARRASRAPGLSMAIVGADGRVWQGASGTTRDGARLAADAPQTLASITKAFTATIAMQLVEEGLLELNVPATRYLPKVRLVHQVRVKQLLNHTSGIADLYGGVKGILHGSPGRALSSNDVLRPIGPAWFPPSKGYGYSNTNFYLLGLIIESVTGKSFNEVLAERITGPLDLPLTRLLTADDSQLPAAWSTGFWTSGAMIAAPAELARFGHALYGGGLVSDKSLRRMTNFDAGHRYGLGTQQLSLGKRKVPGHSGLLYTTTSLLVHLPAEDVTIAIFGTAPHIDLESALADGHAGGPSLLSLALELGR